MRQKFGHWKDSRSSDGSLRTNNLPFDSAADYAAKTHVKTDKGNGDEREKKKTVSFNMATAKLKFKSGVSISSQIDLLVRPPKFTLGSQGAHSEC